MKSMALTVVSLMIQWKVLQAKRTIVSVVVEAKKQVLEESGGVIKKDFWLGSKRFWKSARQVSEALPRPFTELLAVGNNSLRNSWP